MSTKKTFTTWQNEWWQKFNEMKVGSAYEVVKCAKSAELFLDICKDFIDNSEYGYQYELSNDYKLFKRFTDHVMK